MKRASEARRGARLNRSALRRLLFLTLCLALCLEGAAPRNARAGLPAPGERGYGITVFRGEERERFDVEILGSVEAWGSTGGLLLARLSGGPLAETGVMQGMSGSPVYVDGELVGAVMSTWPFAKEAIAGIRPIDEMRQLALDLEGAESESASLGFDPRGDAELVARLAGENDLPALRLPADDLGLVWSASGFASELWPELESALGGRLVAALQGGPSSGTSSSSATLEGGDAVAVLMVDGDARLYATGTVTERIGDTVLGFGHPFLSLGRVNLPMARAEIVALLPSEQISFKMARPLERVGVLRLDRRAGICGRLGEEADMLPVSIRLRGGSTLPQRDYSFEVGRMVELTPNLVAWAAQSALLDERQASDEQVARLRLRVELEGQEALISESALAGPGLATQIGAEFSLPIAVLQRNPERRVRIESLHAELELLPAAQVATLGSVRAIDPELKPGEALRLRAEIRPLRDEPRWIEFELPVPEHLPPGRYRVHVSDGAQAFREELSRSQERWSRLDLRTVREAFALRRPGNELVAVLYGRPRSLVVRGVELEDLPSTVRRVLTRGEASPAASSVAATPLSRTRLETEFVLSGAVQLSFEIEAPRDPETERPPNGGAPQKKRNGNDSRRGERR